MPTADFTIADVLLWARTKPADERFDYCNSDKCALAQFGMATGREWLVGPAGTRWLLERPRTNDAFAGTSKFGELTKELERLLPAEPLSDTWTRADAYLTDIEDVARERVQA